MDTPQQQPQPTQQQLIEARARVNSARLELKRAEDVLRTLSPSDFHRNITQRLAELNHAEIYARAERHNIQQAMLMEWTQQPRIHHTPPQSNVCKCEICTRSVANLVHTMYTPWTDPTKRLDPDPTSESE